jgi:hypothetical protein
MSKHQFLFSAVFGFRNPTQEIFSELDKTKAHGLIFYGAFQNTEEDTRFKRLIRMGAIVVIWLMWLCRNDKVFNNVFFFSYVGHIPMRSYTPFMVATSASVASRPLYGGVYTVG